MSNILKRIHFIKTRGFGYIDIKGRPEDLKGHCKSLKELYEGEMKITQKLDYLLKNGYINQNVHTSLHDNYLEIITSKFGNPILVFNDYQTCNIFSDGFHVTGIIDPGNAMSCLKEHDIGLALVFLEPKYWELFVTGYGYRNEKTVLQFGALLCAFKTTNNFMSGKLDLAQPRLEKLHIFHEKLKS